MISAYYQPLDLEPARRAAREAFAEAVGYETEILPDGTVVRFKADLSDEELVRATVPIQCRKQAKGQTTV